MMHAEYVTKKEKLHELGDEQVDQLLQHASELSGGPRPRRREPSWFGALRSGRGDLSERHEEIVSATFASTRDWPGHRV